LFLTIALLGVILFMSSKRATIVITTKEDSVDIESSVTVGEKNAQVAGTVVTTTVSLAKTFSPTGSDSIPGIATGRVTLHNETNISQPLVKTTRVLSEDGVLFRLTSRVVVPGNGTVNADVYADKEGATGNIEAGKFTIPGLRGEKQKVIYATSNLPMSGGTKTIGILKSSDIKKAEVQLLDEMTDIAKERLQKEAPDVKGVYEVIQQTTETEGNIGEELSEFKLIGKATVIGVFYNPEQVQQFASQQLMKRVIDDVTVLRANEGSATVKLQDYDIKKGTAELAVFHNGVERLNSESKQLQKMLFFGKTKEEVRRHVLTLDHVYSVDVKFRPVWVRTVPFVPDHVQVIVKTVQ
jgi:K+/H+ antiporter YhaU regulatory subunit KhtT